MSLECLYTYDNDDGNEDDGAGKVEEDEDDEREGLSRRRPISSSSMLDNPSMLLDVRVIMSQTIDLLNS